ncbi:MAG: hypothetical protein EXX96DRAFT_562325 [Benjaminiella poitrasii]|nr:MAG: hypothetical protein EXX96DRAFT_562325 [Benjaminiella poitrasii]
MLHSISIMVEIIKRHSTYGEFRNDPILVDLKKRTNDEIFLLLEDLALRLEALYNNRSNLLQQSTYPLSNNNYINSAVTPSYRLSDSIPHQQLTTTASFESFVSGPSFPLKVQQQQVLHGQDRFSAQPQAELGRLKISDNNVIQLPSWTSNSFPNTLIIKPIDLAKCITTKSNPPSILLIDVRPRKAFKSGCIKHQWIIQIEPVILQRDVMTIKIQESLLENPETEQTLFAERERFDLIVYYDQNSQLLETANEPARNIRRALESGRLKRPPMMLSGGFDAWQSIIGERGVYKFPAGKEKKYWFRSSNDSSSGTSTYSSSEPDQHALYDYQAGNSVPHHYKFNSKAPRKELRVTGYPELPSPMTTATNTSTAVSTHYSNSSQPLLNQNLHPVQPTYSTPKGRGTFIDNPFNGFTHTTSKLYDIPPIEFNQTNRNNNNKTQYLQVQQRPSSAEPTVSVSRPSTLVEFHHASSSPMHSNSALGSFSRLGGVIDIGTTGLKNLGNTCYLNSIIQCLSGTLPLARYFISGTFRHHVNRSNKAGTGGVLVEAFSELLRVMWSESCNFVSPMSFREALIRFAPQFSGTDQQDSQEFLVFLLDGLHEDLNQNSHKKAMATQITDSEFEKLSDWQASALSWEKYLARNSSIIVSLFQGQYRSRLTCLSCKHTSTSYNVFMSLSLPIPVKKLRISSVTLYQCLDYFTKEETLDKEDGWSCPKCQKKRKALKQLTLAKIPDILLIHLKRFSVDGLFKNKLDVMVKCPTRSLDLSDYVPMSMTPSPPQDRPSFIYDLYAVSNHYGSLTGGHYTACVRDGYKDKWHYFDDSKFSVYDESKVMTKAAYNLFYVRSKIK